MITIIYAEQWYGVYNSVVDNRRLLLVLPCKGAREVRVNTDYLEEKDGIGHENYVAHRKYTGRLVGAGTWTEGGYTIVPVQEILEYASDGSLFREVRAVSDTQYVMITYTKVAMTTCTSTIVDGGFVNQSYETYYYDTGKTATSSVIHARRLSKCSPPPLHIDIESIKADLAADTGGGIPDIRYSDEIPGKLFKECCHGIMPLETNNIANLISLKDILTGIAGLAKGLNVAGRHLADAIDVDAIDVRRLLEKDVKELPADILSRAKDPKTAADAWLQYRYVYLTTKSDVELHQKELAHVLSDWNASGARKPRRMHATMSKDSTVYNMSVTITPKLSNAVETLWVKSKAYGLQPNAVNAWDMIPFSFIVDWFLPIGDVAEMIDDAVLYNKAHFSFSPIVFSSKTMETVRTQYGDVTRTVYVRDIWRSLPSLAYSDDYEPKTKTKVFRAIDGASLVVGSFK